MKEMKKMVGRRRGRGRREGEIIRKRDAGVVESKSKIDEIKE